MKEEIIKLRNQGKTYRDIKEELGCSLGTIAFHCGEGQKEKYKASNYRRRLRNKDWMEDVKKDLHCESCGEERWWVLDFHHSNPEEKEAGVARLLRQASKERVLKEISKCKVLCSNCHRDLHYKEMLS